MIVVSDTSPLNYLVLIASDQILEHFSGIVLAPPAVMRELQSAHAPVQVRTWALHPPAWLKIQAPRTVLHFPRLGDGESEAISLAKEIQADLLLIDERDGSAAAKQLGLNVTGTLGILDLAASRGLISLPTALTALSATTFRVPPKLIAELLRIDQLRRSTAP